MPPPNPSTALLNGPGILYTMTLEPRGLTPSYLSPNLRRHLGYEPDQHLDDPDWWPGLFHPQDRARIATATRSLLEQGQWAVEYRVRDPNGNYHCIRDAATVTYEAGKPVSVSGVWLDTTQTQWSGNRHLNLLETLRRVDDIIVGNADLDSVLSELLDLTLALFGADRAWLLNPCDPAGDYWQVPMERTRHGWPGAFALHQRQPMTSDLATSFSEILDARGPVGYGPGSGHPVPTSISADFGVKSRLVMAIRPRGGEPWLFGIHYCRAVHRFTDLDSERFAALGDRLGEALDNLLLVKQLHDSEHRYRHLFEQAPISLWEEDASEAKRFLDGIFARGVTDLAAYFDQHPDEVLECANRMRVLNVNQATVDLYAARDKQDLLGNLHKTFTEQSLQVFKQEMITLAGGSGYFAGEAHTRGLDGQARQVMVRAAIAPEHRDDWGRMLVVVSDISARKRAAEEIHRLNRTLRLIGACNQTLMRAHSETELLDEVCHEIIDIGGYRLAWVGLIDEHADASDKTIRCTAGAGHDDGYLKQIHVNWGDGPDGAGPSGSAIRDRQVIVCGNLATDPRYARWQEQATRRGYHSSIALPLQYRDQVFGVLNIYAAQSDAFSKQEQDLLSEFAEDIAYGLQVQRERRRQEQTRSHLQALYDASPDMIFVYTADGQMVDANSNAIETFGYADREAILAAPWEDFMGEGHDTQMALKQIQNARSGVTDEFEWRGRRRDGSQFDVEIRMCRLDEQGRVLVLVRDISRRKSLEARLAQQAYYDELTGLPNRRLALERMNLALSIAKREHSNAALMLLDLDNFKHVNDTYGHDTGDRLLIGVAERLNGAVRGTDTVARLGGDEFVILMSDLHDTGEALKLADKILRVFDRVMVVDGRSLVVTTSIGIARYPDDGDDTDTLMRSADSAMYQAKHEGRNTYCFFSKDINQRMKRYLDVSAALHQAVKEQQLTVHYQPVVDRAGHPIGAETLVRWPHPDWGWVAPTEFIPIAEDRGLIVTIGHRVLRQACEQLRYWLDQGLPFQWVSVNLSPRQFWEQDLSEHIAALLTETGLDGRYLKLEITEGLLLDHPPQALTTLNKLHDLGVRLALDDFGTGYSSLSYLKRYPFDTLKIDRSFVHNLEHDHDDHNLTRTIIAMARALGLKTIAEGVETHAGADLLLTEGCDLLQGFLYSKALPAAELEAWVRAKTGRS